MQEIFGPDGRLAQALPGYEARPGQLGMAEAVDEVLMAAGGRGSEERARILMVEAETGVGKTLAYLVPALLSGQRLVVSTATITLQDQILNKEIPLLEKVLGETIPVLCMKGRQNYLCHYRWHQYCSSEQLSLLADGEIGAISRWLESTETGDRAELDWLADRSPLWPRISAQSDQCLGSDCPEAASCFVARLRKRAGSVRLLVVNHHLFFSDLALRRGGHGEILPRYQGVIFDEAHHLESVASTFFGRRFSSYQLLDLLGDVERQVEADLPGERGDRLQAMARGLRPRLHQFMALFPSRPGRYPLVEARDQIAAWEQELRGLAEGIERLAELLDIQAMQGEVWGFYGERAREQCGHLLEIGLGPEQGAQARYVYWYERRERSISLEATPVKVAAELESALYQMVDSCVMTSATLSAGGNFAYIKERLGLGADCRTLCFHSPFDYANRALVYVPEGEFPEPAALGYDEALKTRTLDLLQCSRGRALLLFTSFRALDLMAEYLGEHLDHPLLVQGSAPRRVLLERFQEDGHSVLLGVASFWEGVDVPGESLSCVIIDKLPFEVPSDPVIKARMAAVENDGGKPFFDFQVPRAILTLRQGVGRLMRSSRDRGVIAIMDVRLFSKGYGRLFRASLPPAPQVRELARVREFFADDHQVASAAVSEMNKE